MASVGPRSFIAFNTFSPRPTERDMERITESLAFVHRHSKQKTKASHMEGPPQIRSHIPLRYCSVKHAWLNYLMTAYFLNLSRHHMCLIRSSSYTRTGSPGVCKRGPHSSHTWGEHWLGSSDMHYCSAAQKRTGANPSACRQRRFFFFLSLFLTFIFFSFVFIEN